MRGTKLYGIIAAAFMAGAIVASPELRTYAADTVFSTDIADGEVKTADLANNAVTAAKIKDGEIKAAEIATNAVGASEITGVKKLIFEQCTKGNLGTLNPGQVITLRCTVTGAAAGDRILATYNGNNPCIQVVRAYATDDMGNLVVRNFCSSTTNPDSGNTFAVQMYVDE